MPGDLRISIGQHSDKGRKQTNQDFHGAFIPAEPLFSIKGLSICLAVGFRCPGVWVRLVVVGGVCRGVAVRGAGFRGVAPGSLWTALMVLRVTENGDAETASDAGAGAG